MSVQEDVPPDSDSLLPIDHPPHAITGPQDQDILCGRDKVTFEWPGNQEVRRMIWESLPEYSETDTRTGKSKIIKKLVEDTNDAGRRFLKWDHTKKAWYEIGEYKACELVLRAFKDAAIAKKRHHSKYRKLKASNTPETDASPRSVINEGDADNPTSASNSSIELSCEQSDAEAYVCEACHL